MYERVKWPVMEVLTMRLRQLKLRMLRFVVETSFVMQNLRYSRVLRPVVNYLLNYSRVIMQPEAKGQSLLKDWVLGFVM